MKLTDMHTHILYGGDLLAQSLNDSMELIMEEWARYPDYYDATLCLKFDILNGSF